MKTTLGSVWAFFVILFVPAISVGQVQVVKLDCATTLRKVRVAGQRAVKSDRAYANPKLETVVAVQKGFRGSILMKLQVLNEEPYPFVDKSETPLALAWAKNIFKRLTSDQAAILNMDVIRADLLTTIETVAAYPAKLGKLVDEAANLAMEQKTLKHALGRWFPWPKGAKVDLSKSGPIEIQIPYYVDGKLQDKLRTEYYGSAAQLLIAAKKEVDRDFRRLSQELRELGSQQAKNIQKLEVFVHEFRRQESLDPSFDRAQIASQYTDLLDGINAFYVSGQVDGILKPEIAPPYQAWSLWHWKALTRQVVTIWWKKKAGVDGATADARFASADLWKLINSLSDEEKRSLGLGNIVNGVEIMKQSKWIRWLSVIQQSRWGRIAKTWLLPLAAGVGAGLEKKDEFGQSWLVGAAKEFMADFFERDKCVHTESDSEFKKCVAKYLQTRFPKQYLYDLMEWENLVSGGQIRDVKIQAVVEEIKSERRIYQQNKKLESLLANALDSALEDPADVTSDLYRKNLVKSADERTMIFKLLSPVAGVGYFATRFPYEYQVSEIRALVRIAVENREDDLIWKASLSRLRDNKFGANIAKELEQIITDRAAYVMTRKNLQEVDKMIDDAIKVDRGTTTDDQHP